jgi:hypothetical protein
MKGLKIFLLIAAGCLVTGSLYADIYEWTDKNGVKHFTNYAPPDDATLLMKSEELPYDAAADRARIEADRQQQLEFEKLEIAQREAELARREAEAEQRAAEAERYAEETVRAADQYLEDTRNDRWYYRGGGIWGGYRSPHSRRSFYRNETASIYWVDRPYIDHYKSKYRKKGRYGHSGNYHGNRYRQKKHAFPIKYQSPHSRSGRSRNAQGAYRGHSRSRGQMGRTHSRRGSSGLRR